MRNPTYTAVTRACAVVLLFIIEALSVTAFGRQPSANLAAAAAQATNAVELLESAVGPGGRGLQEMLSAGRGDASQRADLEPRVRLLEKAVALEPGLMDAHYWLGHCLSLLVFGETSTVKRLTLLDREVREFEAVLAGTAPGCPKDPHGPAPSAASPQALREKTFQELIQGLCAFQNLVDVFSKSDTPNHLTPLETAEWAPKGLAAGQRLHDLVVQYLTEPPKKVRGDYYHLMPAYRLRLASTNNAQPLIDWYLLLDRVYGADHAAYDVRCPLLCLAQQLLWAKRPQQALVFFDRGMKAHGHDGATRCLSGLTALRLEQDIRQALGEGESDRANEIKKTLKAEQAEHEDRQSCEPLREAFSKWPGADSPVAEAPEGLVDTVARFPYDGSVMAAASDRSGGYFFIGGEGTTVGSGDNQRRDRYRLQKLVRRPAGTNAPVEMPIERNGEAARVTVILPVRDVIWIGTHQGLVRYDARRNDWRWLGAADGLPTNCILCGVYAEGKLWFGGGENNSGGLIFSLEPGNGRIRAYPPDISLGRSPPWGIAVRKDEAFVSTASRVCQIDLRSGRWRKLDLLPAAGKWAAYPGEAWHNEYYPTTAPVFCRGRWWVGTTGGLAVMDPGVPPAFRVLFSSGFNEAPTMNDVFGRMCIPPDCPIRAPVSGLATDGMLLWMTCNGLAAYDPKRDVWHGPLAVPGVEPSVVGADIWLLDRSCIKVNAAAFVKAAEAAGRRWTTARYRDGLAQVEPDTQRGLRAAARLNFAEAASCFERVADSEPASLLPLFWKAYCLERECPPDWAGAIGLYERIDAMAASCQTTGVMPGRALARETTDENTTNEEATDDESPAPSPQSLRRLAQSAKLRCLYYSGQFDAAFDMRAICTNGQLVGNLAWIPAWAAVHAGRLADTPALADARIGRFLGPDYGPVELHMAQSAWDAVIQTNATETLWQKGFLTQAVASAESAEYLDPEFGPLYLDAGLVAKAAELLRKSAAQWDIDAPHFKLMLTLLYRDEPQLAEAGTQLREHREAGRLSPAALHSMSLLEVRLEALTRAGRSGAAALVRAEGALYRGLYRAGEAAVGEMAQRTDEHHPLLQAEASRLLWETRTFAHGVTDPALLQLARTRYRAATKGRGPEAMWALHSLVRLAVACNEDVRPLAAEAARRFPRTVVAEEARRFANAALTGDPPLLCARMGSPQDCVPARVFPRRGFVVANLGDQCGKITRGVWTDGMGAWNGDAEIAGEQGHSWSLVWPGYAFRPGVCLVDYYAGRQFVSRRVFIVKGEVPNEANEEASHRP